MEAETDLFVPLKREYFYAFASGEKREELRRYGPRWNEKVCRVGRSVVLSLGYGRRRRMGGVVVGFQVKDAAALTGAHRDAMLALYGSLDFQVAVIAIDLKAACPFGGRCTGAGDNLEYQSRDACVANCKGLVASQVTIQKEPER